MTFDPLRNAAQPRRNDWSLFPWPGTWLSPCPSLWEAYPKWLEIVREGSVRSSLGFCSRKSVYQQIIVANCQQRCWCGTFERSWNFPSNHFRRSVFNFTWGWLPAERCPFRLCVLYLRGKVSQYSAVVQAVLANSALFSVWAEGRWQLICLLQNRLKWRWCREESHLNKTKQEVRNQVGRNFPKFRPEIILG